MAKALGINDSITTCDCCGKSNLKFTVAIQLDDGEVVHYGRVCASRNTGKAPKVINAEIKIEAMRIRAAAAAEFRVTPEYIACAAKLAARPRHLIGRIALDYIREESIAEGQARAAVATKFGLKPYEVGY